jgi:PAS domain S-box-containing protein
VPRNTLNNILSRFTQPPWTLACLTLLFGLLISWQIGQLEAERRLAEMRSQAVQDLATIRARLEGVVTTVFSATSGLAEVIAHQGGISPDLFEALARQAIKGSPQIRNIGIAPDNVMARIYPLEENRQAIGFRYASIPEQYEAVRKAMVTRLPVLAGPHRLVQGGEGLIARVPVFTSAGLPSGAEPRYWGIVSVVTHPDGLLDAAGVRATDTLDIGLRQLDDHGQPGTVIRDSHDLFSRNPVCMAVTVPGGQWQLGAVRTGGWPQMPVTHAPLFLVGVGNSLGMAVFVWWLASRPARVRLRNQELQREIAERRRVEEDLRLSEQKYAAIFHLMPDIAGITRMSNGCFIEVNAGFTARAGWEAQEILGRTSLELGLWTPETRAQAVTIMQEQGRLENFEFLMTTKSGEQRHCLMYMRPIEVWGEGCIYFMVRDITELKQAQLVLENERVRLRNLLQTVPAMIWMKDPQGIYLSCNSRFERFFGAKEQEIIGKTDYDFVSREQADFFREYDRRAIANGQVCINEERVVYADDGHQELLETVKTPVYDGGGNLLGVLGIAWDITEKKRIEEELRTERARFIKLVDSVDGIVWEADAQTFTFTYVSRQAERLLGYPVEAWAVEGFWLAHLHPEDRERVSAHTRARTLAGEDHELEYRFLAQSGEMVWIQDRVTVVSENGVPRWRRGIMVDTSGRKEEEKNRRGLEAQLRQAQKMEAVGRLAGGVAHDFNNQLSVILGYADLVKSGPLSPDKTRGYLNQIIRAATQSRDITRQLLAFSRQEAISPQVLDLNALVKGVHKGLGRLIREDIRFEVRLAEGVWPIHMDPTQVDQVLMNLVVNARDAMEHGGQLVVATANVHLDASFVRHYPDITAGDYVQLTVSDTGSGMAQETLAHIFEPFYTTKESGKGTGLGLATVYGIVTQNRGLVLVESELGAGTTFKVFFPRSLVHAEGTSADALQPLSRNRSGIILLVEDEESVRQMTQDILEMSGYTVLVAQTPQQALAFCDDDDQRIDLLLTDVIMPDMNGRELSHHIRLRRPGIKVLFMSGYAADILPMEDRDSEHSFVKKPFTVQGLQEKIEMMLQAEPGKNG